VNTVTIGIVTDCLALSIREEPDSDGKVIGTVDALSELMIDEGASNEDFYKVCTEAGVEGFCSKRYVAVRPKE
jgi:hypothetical protein